MRIVHLVFYQVIEFFFVILKSVFGRGTEHLKRRVPGQKNAAPLPHYIVSSTCPTQTFCVPAFCPSICLGCLVCLFAPLICGDVGVDTDGLTRQTDRHTQTSGQTKCTHY